MAVDNILEYRCDECGRIERNPRPKRELTLYDFVPEYWTFTYIGKRTRFGDGPRMFLCPECSITLLQQKIRKDK